MADLRAAHPASSHDAGEARPITLRRKRRASSAHPLQPPQIVDGRTTAPSSGPTPPKTPRREKRVRFSFPPDQSTGLTQRIARTRLVTNADTLDDITSRLLSRRPRHPRRAASVGPTELAQLSSNNIEIQFKPIRQILSERTRRRLTRNNLSETMNDIAEEKKSHAAVCEELGQVKQELEELTARAVPVFDHPGRIQELEKEIEGLKKQLSTLPSSRRTESPERSDLEALDLVANNDEVEENDFSIINSDEDLSSRPRTPITPVSLYASTATSMNSPSGASRCTQTEMTEANLAEIQQHLQLQSENLRRARMDLERLMPGETSLPLASPTKTPRHQHEPASLIEFPLIDVEPLITALFGHLHNMSQRAARTAQALAAAEDQKANLKGHFRAALHQLDEMRAAHAILLAETQRREPRTPASSPVSSNAGSARSDNGTANPTNAKEDEQTFEDAQKRIKKLEEEASGYDKDRTALISALEKYRSEVKDLEVLITNMEADHKARLQNLKSEHSVIISDLMGEHAQAIEDLETEIAAESQGRREAEAEIDTIMGRWGDQRERGDRDMGRLNVQIATLTDQLEERERSVCELHKHLEGVREKVELFVSSVGGQLAWAEIEARTGNVVEPDLPSNTSQQAKSMPPAALSWGLLTPHVESGRFRDAIRQPLSPDMSSDPAVISSSIDGKVEFSRGKKRSRSSRKDSGIGTLIEHDDED